MQTEYHPVLLQLQQSWNRSVRNILLMLAVVLVSWYYVGLFDVERLREGVPSMASLVGEMFPPNFTAAGSWIKPLLDTLAMSIAGTAIAVLLSLPLAILAARNTSPHPVVYQVSRWLLNALRSIPELIMGIIFVAAVGFGALPGVLALGFHSIGMIAKFFAEAIEHADQAPVEAARAAGCSPLQVMLPRHSAAGVAADGRHLDLSMGIQLPRFHRDGNGWRWRHRLRTDGFSSHHAIPGGFRNSAGHPGDGNAGRRAQFIPAP